MPAVASQGAAAAGSAGEAAAAGDSGGNGAAETGGTQHVQAQQGVPQEAVYGACNVVCVFVCVYWLVLVAAF